MLSEDFDKRIKEAADQHHPAYDEKAWQKMEKLLNRNLPPEKEDRRRLILALLLLLFIGGGTYFFLTRSGSGNHSDLVEAKKPDATLSHSTPSQGQESAPVTLTTPAVPPATKEPGNGQASSRSDRDQILGPVSLAVGVKAHGGQAKPLTLKDATTVVASRPDNSATDNSNDQNKTASLANNKKEVSSTSTEAISGKKDETLARTGNQTATLTMPELTTADSAKASEAKEGIKEQASPVVKKSSPKKSAAHKNGLSFFLSAGPDVSKAGTSKTGKTTLLYGAGIGYTLNRFTLTTGVYASKKIYWAGAADYTLYFVPSPATKFVGANADCDVIDIPVKLSYLFDRTDKSNWFAGAGLSSYLMKKESYVFAYKTASSTYYYPYQTRNENKHYFSVLNLSAGYTRKISRVISLTAEPYVEVPLTGIGLGKVHLNSGGILFSIGLQPFKK